MEALVLKIRNLDEITCTKTSAKSNVFVPGNVIYRTALQGAMIRALLCTEGQNYTLEYMNLIQAMESESLSDGYNAKALESFYAGMIEKLPKVVVSDGVLLKESQVQKEIYNSIYRGTTTALASLKAASQITYTIPNVGYEMKQGKLKGFDEKVYTGLYNYDFSSLSDGKLRETMISKVADKAHFFRAPGAIWRIGFFGERKELEEAYELFSIAINELGVGAQHAFRGKCEILEDSGFLPVREFSESIDVELFQPLFCPNGKLFDALKQYNLNPKYGFQITQRREEFYPTGKTVIAIEGKFQCSSGNYIETSDGRFLVLPLNR